MYRYPCYNESLRPNVWLLGIGVVNDSGSHPGHLVKHNKL